MRHARMHDVQLVHLCASWCSCTFLKGIGLEPALTNQARTRSDQGMCISSRPEAELSAAQGCTRSQISGSADKILPVRELPYMWGLCTGCKGFIHGPGMMLLECQSTWPSQHDTAMQQGNHLRSLATIIGQVYITGVRELFLEHWIFNTAKTCS